MENLKSKTANQILITNVNMRDVFLAAVLIQLITYN